RARPTATATGPAKAKGGPGDESATGEAGTARGGGGSGAGTGGGHGGGHGDGSPAGEDSFQQMRHLLAGRRQLLGKLVGGGAGGGSRSAPGNSVVIDPARVQEALGLLQEKAP